MKKYLVGFYFSLPVQLFLLHFRRYQVLLIFWYILFATVAGHFMKTFGANSLFLAPEYLGKVNALSTAIVGAAISIFIMSWNITTFILFTRHIRFLATTAQPFLKYCINNFILPLIFIVFYLVKAFEYDRFQQLLSLPTILFLAAGFFAGFLLMLFISFAYFFSVDKTIYRSLGPLMALANKQYEKAIRRKIKLPVERSELRIDWFLSARFHLRKPRDIRHYSEDFVESIFKKHHFAAILAVIVGYLFLIAIGYLFETPAFVFPAAASVTIFFAILIAVAGAFSLFLRNWSLVVLFIFILLLDFLFQKQFIDFRNKVSGLNYTERKSWPAYDEKTIFSLANADSVAKDKQEMITILNNWKARQGEEKPVMFLVSASGGGLRSASFSMNVLQYLDSITHGEFFKKTVLMSGASGGMLGAAYFRELYYQRSLGSIVNLQNDEYVENITKDLLNPLFSSLITRDLIGPLKQFDYNGLKYNKDRGYAFEQQLNNNTGGLMNKKVSDYAAAESEGALPMIVLNSVITRDTRKMLIGSRPMRYMMHGIGDSTKPYEIDAIDFQSYFQKQGAANTSFLSALRMNATFPFVLPTVWLPTTPVIDVMDAGLRDNFGPETTLRFLHVFKDWLQKNTSKVVVVQMRDTQMSDWTAPEAPGIFSLITKPFTLLQSNWYNLQNYYVYDALKYVRGEYGENFMYFPFQYLPAKKDAGASLSFHLTASEKNDISQALGDSLNQVFFHTISSLIKKDSSLLNQLKAAR
jgi:hypothetical protein